MNCPNCKSEMSKIKERDITIDRCEKCGGIFLDKGELNILATGMAGDIEFCSIDDNIHKDKFGVRNCPKCSCLFQNLKNSEIKTCDQKMRKVNLLSHSDTIFDFCPKCEGFFLDKRELETMNLELEELTKNKQPEEYRGHKENHLVRLDKIKDVVMTGFGPFPYTQNICFLRMSVYFEKPLGIGLRIYSEKQTEKLSKLFGLFKGQDTQIGDEELDRAFIIQGKDKQKIKILLSSKEIKKELLNFVLDKPKILTTPSRIEITDRRIILTEGPYIGSGNYNYDIENDPSGAATRAIKLALLFEKFTL